MRQSETILLQVLQNTNPEAGEMLQCFVKVILKQQKKNKNILINLLLSIRSIQIAVSAVFYCLVVRACSDERWIILLDHALRLNE